MRNDDPTIFESERLQDPLNDRVVKSVPRPPTVALTIDRVFPIIHSATSDSKTSEIRHEVPNLALIRDYLMQMGTISKALMLELVAKVKRVFDLEPNLLRVTGKTYIFGDIHGQFYDLMHMLSNLEPPGGRMNYVFLGDYVDRGG